MKDNEEQRFKKQIILSARNWIMYIIMGMSAAVGCGVALRQFKDVQGTGGILQDDPEDVSNWSDTHTVNCRKVLYPENKEELQDAIFRSHQYFSGCRPTGSHLSPNGLSFKQQGMLSLQLLDKILEIDTEKKQVTVEAGARIEQVAEALRPYGLTLANYASIKDQTVGGLVMVGGHGTGARIPPVDEMVTKLDMMFPKDALNSSEVSASLSPELFDMVRVSMGSIGIMYSATLQCIDAHKLLQKTFVVSRKDLMKNHIHYIQDNEYVRYMWIPYTDSVVVETSNKTHLDSRPSSFWQKTYSDHEKLGSLRTLYKKNNPDISDEKLNKMTAMELRDHLIALDPLDWRWIKRINEAERDFWTKQDSKVDSQEKLLAFDCGGQQLVLEVAIPCGTIDKPDLSDLRLMDELLQRIENEKIPAPSPIEQRFSARSTSKMSPCYSEDPNAIFSWIGIIMYLPSDDQRERNKITATFREYSRVVDQELIPKYNGAWHWAKIEVPESLDDLEFMQGYLSTKYPLKQFNVFRTRYDPYNNLQNGMLDILMPRKRG